MAAYTYDPGLVIDDATGEPVPNATGELRATPGGSAVAVEDLLGTPLAGLSTNAAGVCERFSAAIARGYMYFGSVPQAVASDQVQDSLVQATAAAASAATAASAAGTASSAATAAASAASTAAATATAAAATVAGFSDVATSGDYADLIGTPAIPATAADVGAFPANIRRWNGATWSARPSVPSGYTVESYSDGSYGSTYDVATTAPPSSQTGDGWTKA